MRKWIKPEITVYRDMVFENGWMIPAWMLCPLLRRLGDDRRLITSINHAGS